MSWFAIPWRRQPGSVPAAPRQAETEAVVLADRLTDSAHNLQNLTSELWRHIEGRT